MLKPKTTIFVDMFFIGAIFMLAVFLRTFALDKQGLLHYDEGRMVYRSSELSDFFLHEENAHILKPSYVDSKMLWLILIALADAALIWGLCLPNMFQFYLVC